MHVRSPKNCGVLGFDVLAGEDLTKLKMRAMVQAFYATINPGSAALIFFSGFGVQAGGRSYILPVDSQIEAESEVGRNGISVEWIVEQMSSRGAAVKLVIIDAARPNPLERRFRSYYGGLAPLNAPPETLAMYSAEPKKVNLANETGDENSLFVGELLNQMRMPDESAEQVFRETSTSVARASNNKQVPWIFSSITQTFYFQKQSAIAAAQQRLEEALRRAYKAPEGADANQEYAPPSARGLPHAGPKIALPVPVNPSQGQRLPNFFPWPPPPASAKSTLPVTISNSERFKTLGDVADYIQSVLRRAAIAEWSYFSLPEETAGFGMVTISSSKSIQLQVNLILSPPVGQTVATLQRMCRFWTWSL